MQPSYVFNSRSFSSLLKIHIVRTGLMAPRPKGGRSLLSSQPTLVPNQPLWLHWSPAWADPSNVSSLSQTLKLSMCPRLGVFWHVGLLLVLESSLNISALWFFFMTSLLFSEGDFPISSHYLHQKIVLFVQSMPFEWSTTYLANFNKENWINCMFLTNLVLFKFNSIIFM